MRDYPLDNSPDWRFGTDLTAQGQREALATFTNRYTGDNKPAWANKPRPDGTPYAVQFESDLEWLRLSMFAVRKDGRLDRRVTHCESGKPTWPNNPELRD